MRKTDTEAFYSCVIFRGLKPDELDGLLSDFAFEIKSYKKNDKIFSPDCFSKSLAIILKGSAFVYKQTDKAPLLMSYLGKSSIFGMSAMFYEEKAFPTIVSAREPCRVLFISKAELERIFLKYPLTLNNYISVLSEKIHFLNSKIDRLTSAGATVRLKAYLENTADKLNTDEFMLPVSFSELSSALSVGRTSLYRAFDELIKEGFLEKDGKAIKLKNN